MQNGVCGNNAKADDQLPKTRHCRPFEDYFRNTGDSPTIGEIRGRIEHTTALSLARVESRARIHHFVTETVATGLESFSVYPVGT
jgi:hypothetical protein